MSRLERPKHGGNSQVILATDWRLGMCDQANGKDFLADWGPEPEIRAKMDRETARGADVWITDPDGVKHLPENS